ncbi:MAG: hypothetical protein GY818_16870, partial [Planctomycetaceae bacterium]|nr:hypothetical protein [Planctomycetaceae bacterium]
LPFKSPQSLTPTPNGLKMFLLTLAIGFRSNFLPTPNPIDVTIDAITMFCQFPMKFVRTAPKAMSGSLNNSVSEREEVPVVCEEVIPNPAS